jgi:hypothetical protein
MEVEVNGEGFASYELGRILSNLGGKRQELFEHGEDTRVPLTSPPFPHAVDRVTESGENTTGARPQVI